MKLLYLSEHHSCFNYELKLTVVLPNTDWLRKNPDRLIIVVVFVFYFF